MKRAKKRNDRRGGKRVGAGRRAEDGATCTTRFSVSLDPATALFLVSELGFGNLSQGVREAARLARLYKLHLLHPTT